MNSSQLDEARSLWMTEKALYEDYGEMLKNEVMQALKSARISASYDYRVKKDDSLLKKMLKDKEYSDINDKVGVRAIVNFKSDLEIADSIILETFGERILKRDNKMETADNETFGYLSIHYDIINSTTDLNSIIGELQLRTICQNTWSVLSHILSYKSDKEIPNDIRRGINALSALMEIADNQFERIFDMVKKLPVSNPNRVLQAISGFFYSNIAAWYDIEMSHYFLDDIARLYKEEEDIVHILEEFIKENGDDISEIASRRQDILFFSQPEIVVILERLENEKYILEDYWIDKYPKEQLDKIANAWGTSMT